MQRRRPESIPLRDLKPSDAGPASLRLRSRAASIGIQALAPDYFRVVASRHGSTPPPSWAVVKPAEAWSVPETRVRRRGRHITLETTAAAFRIDLASGAWQVLDRHGIPVFAAPPGAITVADTETRLALSLAKREIITGLGESSGTFDKRGLIREFWNIDVLGHAPAMHPGLRSLYVSVPFALSLRDGRAAGLFWDNPARQTWDLGATDRTVWRMSVASGPLDLHLFTGPRPADVVARFTELTGRMPLPPRWALGHQQCRYSYASGAELEAVAREFRRRKLPCDVLYCDIHHLDGNRVFTFGETYPQPDRLIARLAQRGFKVIPIVNPGVKDVPRFGVLRRGRKRDAFVKAPQGNADFIGEAWPGPCRYPDFLRADVRSWWGDEQQALLKRGAAGIWNDMNEPANFARPDRTLDPKCLHRTDHGPRRHAEVHNVYGLQMARASYEGAIRPSDGGIPRRPLIVTRAGYAGVQRYAAVWTGDNSSTWEHLDESVRQLLNLGLSGVPFVGADLGGFLDHCTPELFIRWLQTAVFTPFLRNHSNIGTTRQEPWAFGPEVESIARRYLDLRYQLLPWLYSLFAEAARSGAPVMRPLLWHHPNDPVAVTCTDQFLVGEHLLVAPILRAGAVARSVYLPRGEWFDFHSGTPFPGGVHAVVHAPLDHIPVFVRSGALIPLAPTRPCVGPREPATLVLHVWPGTDGRLDWYDDDGHTLAHASGDWQRRTLTAVAGPRGGHLVIGPREGRYPGHTRRWRIIVREVTRASKVRVAGKAVPAEFIPELRILAFDVPAIPGAMEARWR